MRGKTLSLIIATALLLPACSGSRQDTPSELLFNTHYIAPSFNGERDFSAYEEVAGYAHDYYREITEEYQIPGVAFGLVVDDSLVFSGGYGFADPQRGILASAESQFRIASMSKSFTAMAILQLRDAGKLELTDPVSLYIPELDSLIYLSRDALPVTIFNLLTMTAGFPEDNPWGDRFLDITEEALIRQISEGISFSSTTPLNYEYSNLGYGLLGVIIHRISGLPYQDYITKNIFAPLGMQSTFYEFEDADPELLAHGYRLEDGKWKEVPLLHDGAFGSMGGLITSVRDLAHYTSFHLSAWPPRNDPETGPLKRSSVREMQHMNKPRFYKDPYRFGEPDLVLMRGYGYGLVTMKDQEGIVETGHNGGLPGFGSSYVFYPKQGIGIMAFGNLTYVGSKVRRANYRLIGDLQEAGLFEDRTLPPSDILRQRAAELARFLQNRNPELEQNILADNFYMDRSREQWMKDIDKGLAYIGELRSISQPEPENQLRGSFVIRGSKASLRVHFTLSPEKDPKVQWMEMNVI